MWQASIYILYLKFSRPWILRIRGGDDAV
jgi:hypothetical protein